MNRDKLVWVEMGVYEPVYVRIFRNKSAAYASQLPIGRVRYGAAVEYIRHAIWDRCKGECEMCASPVIESSGHMHEMKHRGKGGEVSLANSVFICPTCHAQQHSDRQVRFKKKHLTIKLDWDILPSDSNTPGHRVP